MPIKEIYISAGGIISRRIRGEVLVLFITTKEGRLTFPKGHIRKGETTEQAAIREVKEEIGILDLHVIRKLGIIQRRGVEPDGAISQKEIHLFMMKGAGMTFVHDEDFVWIELRRAPSFMQFDEERNFILQHQDTISSMTSNDLNQYDLENQWNDLHQKNQNWRDSDVIRENHTCRQTIFLLGDGNKIFEVGVSTGRDALWFAQQKGIRIIGCDISEFALEKTCQKFQQAGLKKLFIPVHQAAENLLISDIPEGFHLFYSRFSLNLSDTKTFFLLNNIVKKMIVGGYFVLEGKTDRDYKMQQSRFCGPNLVMDGRGFLIRVWDEDFIFHRIIRPLKLKMIEISRRPYQRKNEDGESLVWIAQKVENYSY